MVLRSLVILAIAFSVAGAPGDRHSRFHSARRENGAATRPEAGVTYDCPMDPGIRSARADHGRRR